MALTHTNTHTLNKSAETPCAPAAPQKRTAPHSLEHTHTHGARISVAGTLDSGYAALTMAWLGEFDARKIRGGPIGSAETDDAHDDDGEDGLD